MSGGYLDAKGVWIYGEDDLVSPFSSYMNLGQNAQSAKFAANDARLATLEGKSVEIGTWTITSNFAVATGAFVMLTAATAVTVTNPGLMTNSGGVITVTAAGMYTAHAHIVWPGGAGTRRAVMVTKNAATIDAGGNVAATGVLLDSDIVAPGTNEIVQSVATEPFPLLATDTVRFFLFQDVPSTTLNVQAGSSAKYLGQTRITLSRVG